MISIDSINLLGVLVGYRNVLKHAKGTVYVAENFPGKYLKTLEAKGLHIQFLEVDRFTLGKKLGRQNMVAVIGNA